MDAVQLKLKAFCCRHISRWDIQVALRCGCPSIDRKVVNSGKRLRAYVGLDEGEVITWNYLLKSYLVAARFSFPINLKGTLHSKYSKSFLSFNFAPMLKFVPQLKPAFPVFWVNFTPRPTSLISNESLGFMLAMYKCKRTRLPSLIFPMFVRLLPPLSHLAA
jgi:hypothetical protein